MKYNCADFCKKSTSDEVKALILKLRKPITDECEAFVAKCNEYVASKDKRFKKITDQITQIEAQKAAAEEQFNHLKKGFVQATLSGDPALLKKVQGDMSQCEADMAAFDAQIEALRGYVITGDPLLFDEIKADYAALNEHIDAMNEQLISLSNAITEIRKAWSTTEEMAANSYIQKHANYYSFEQALERANKVYGSSKTVGAILRG